jgi:hypothetical protein
VEGGKRKVEKSPKREEMIGSQGRQIIYRRESNAEEKRTRKEVARRNIIKDEGLLKNREYEVKGWEREHEVRSRMTADEDREGRGR